MTEADLPVQLATRLCIDTLPIQVVARDDAGLGNGVCESRAELLEKVTTEELEARAHEA